MDILKKRSDFLKTAKGLKYVSRGFVLQALQRNPAVNAAVNEQIRIGFTASKKVGNAVCRNRAKRRLREVARNIANPVAKMGYDYVFIARKNILAMEFDQLMADVQQAMQNIHRAQKQKKP